MRAFLSDGVTAGAPREGPGIGGLTTAAEVALRAVIEPWLGVGRTAHVVLCGMAGSRNGHTLQQPQVWHHDVLRSDGTPYRRHETDLIKILSAAPKGQVPPLD